MFKTDHFKDKCKTTCLEKYGVENTANIPGVVDKRKQTNLERYGVENVSQSEKIKELKRLTSLERYGVEYPMKLKCVVDKIRTTCIERYGVDNVFKSDWFKEHVRKVNYERYGVEYPILINHYHAVDTNTLVSRYNTLVSIDNTEDLEKFIRDEYRSPYRNLHKFNLMDRYDGSVPEHKVAKWLEYNSIVFVRNFRPEWMIHPGTGRARELDFFIPSHNLAIEVNGDYTHRFESHEYEYHKFKFDRCFENGVKLIMITESDIRDGRLDEILNFNLYGGDITVYDDSAIRLGFKPYRKECEFQLMNSGDYQHLYPV